MHNAQLGQVIYGSDQLLKQAAGFLFFQLALRSNVREQLAIAAVFHDDVQARRGFNNFIHLNYVGVTDHLQNVQLTHHSLYVCHLGDLVLD